MEALFEIGQKVVALVNQANGVFKKGDEFTVLAIKQICCYMCIQISTNVTPNMTLTCTCGSATPSDVMYFNQEEFAPVQELGDMTFEEAIGLVTIKEMV